MTAAVLRLADDGSQKRALSALDVFCAQAFPMPANEPGWTWTARGRASARRPRVGAGWSALPLTPVHEFPLPQPPEEVPVYSLAAEPSPPRGEFRWVGRVICFMTVFATGSAMMSLVL